MGKAGRKKKNRVFFHRRDGENLSSAFYTSAPEMCLYQTPGRRPPLITGRVVSTATRGWVGPPNERAPFRYHDALVVFVD